MNVDYDNIDNIDWEQFKIDAQKELEGGQFLNICCWTDVYPCLILEIKGKKMRVEQLGYIGDRTIPSERGHQNWIIYRESNDPIIRVFTLRKNGMWTEQGSAMGQGYCGHISDNPRYYHDWEF